MRAIISLLVLFALVGGGFSLFWFSTQQVTERQLRQEFEAISAAMASQDKDNVGKKLQALIAPDATIQLNVRFSALAVSMPATEGPGNRQDFTRATFLPFIDNLLFSVKNYEAHGDVGEVIIKDDGTADVAYTMHASASGNSYAMGTSIPSRWVTRAECKSNIMIGDVLVFKTVVCDVNVAQRPDVNHVNIGDVYNQLQKP